MNPYFVTVPASAPVESPSVIEIVLYSSVSIFFPSSLSTFHEAGSVVNVIVPLGAVPPAATTVNFPSSVS